MRLVASLVVLFFFSFAYGQIHTPVIDEPTAPGGSSTGPSAGGTPFPFTAHVQFSGEPANCTFTFSHLTRLVGTTLRRAECEDPGTSGFTTLTCTNITNGNVSTPTPLELYQVSLVIADVCPTDEYTIAGDCLGTATSPPEQGPYTINIGTSALEVEISDDSTLGNTDNLTNVRVADARTAPIYHVTAVVRNASPCAAATGVVCTIDVPSPLTTVQSKGLVEYDQALSTNTGRCSRVLNVFTCPSPTGTPSSDTIAINGSVSYTFALHIDNNGTLESSIRCNATRIGEEVNVFAEQLAYAIGFISNESSSAQQIFKESDNTDDLVINTIIPLSVFGGVMGGLLCLGATTVGIYIFVKKVILAEENVGF